MRIALDEAEKAFKEGNYPVGAVLVIDEKIIDSAHNKQITERSRNAHAEYLLLHENSKIIRKKVRRGSSSKAELYSTLEPCLMCLGSAVFHRISRIIFACPDPRGGATYLNPEILSSWYVKNWPVIQGGLYDEPSYALICKFLKESAIPEHKNILRDFENMKKS
ncbi:MAG: nucleoside deaminase [Candidatus Hodarchaeota archaeon]